jgi:hypothetical protein
MVPMFGGKNIGMALIPFIVGLIVLAVDKNKRTFHERTANRWFVAEGFLGWVGLEMIRRKRTSAYGVVRAGYIMP